jgi:hypothetical protein
MTNVTISVPEELKAEMDKFPEVSWSETCRKAIAQYISERKYPSPNIELDIRDVRLAVSHDSGYPAFTATLRIHNKMNSDIILDRILFNVKFYSPKDGAEVRIGSHYDLYRRVISSNSIGGAQIYLPISKEKVESLEVTFGATFSCIIDCVVFADGFKNPCNQSVRTEVPIDKWDEFVDAILETFKE